MAPKTILLKGDPLQKIAQATAVAITPGMLLQYSSVAGRCEAHGVSGGVHNRMFAIEDALQGREIGTDYDANDNVQFVSCRPGDEVYAWLKDGENVARGDYLESNGDGGLVAWTSVGVAPVGVVLEDLDLSGSANLTNDGRVKIEVI